MKMFNGKWEGKKTSFQFAIVFFSCNSSSEPNVFTTLSSLNSDLRAAGRGLSCRHGWNICLRCERGPFICAHETRLPWWKCISVFVRSPTGLWQQWNWTNLRTECKNQNVYGGVKALLYHSLLNTRCPRVLRHHRVTFWRATVPGFAHNPCSEVE